MIRRLEDSVKERLRVRASSHGRSMEEEARQILRCVLAGRGVPERDLGESIHRRFALLGGVDLPQLAREPMREPLDFSK